MPKRIFSAVIAGILLSSCQNTDNLAIQEKNLKQDASSAETRLAETDANAAADGASNDEVDGVSTSALATSDTGAVQKLFAQYNPPEKGTRFTWRSNWASMPPLVTYEADGVVSVGESEYVRFKSVAGLSQTTFAYYDTGNFALKGYRNGKNEALTTFKPVEERYQFPLEKGKQWVSQWKMIDHQTGKVSSGGGVFKVVAIELVKTPAGNFQAARIKVPAPRELPEGMSHYIWFAPKLGVTIKEQIGNGQMNWTQVLEKVEMPKKG